MKKGKPRKLFYVLYSILKEDVGIKKGEENRFVYNLGFASINYKKSLDLNKPVILDDFRYNSVITNLNDKLPIIINALCNNSYNLDKLKNFNRYKFMNNYIVYKGLSYLFYEFDNKKIIISDNYYENFSIFSDTVERYMKRFDIYKNDDGELMRDGKKIK